MENDVGLVFAFYAWYVFSMPGRWIIGEICWLLDIPGGCPEPTSALQYIALAGMAFAGWQLILWGSLIVFDRIDSIICRLRYPILADRGD